LIFYFIPDLLKLRHQIFWLMMLLIKKNLFKRRNRLWSIEFFLRWLTSVSRKLFFKHLIIINFSAIEKYFIKHRVYFFRNFWRRSFILRRISKMWFILLNLLLLNFLILLILLLLWLLRIKIKLTRSIIIIILNLFTFDSCIISILHHLFFYLLLYLPLHLLETFFQRFLRYLIFILIILSWRLKLCLKKIGFASFIMDIQILNNIFDRLYVKISC